MNTTLKIIVIALFYVMTITTGIIMHKIGRPFKSSLSTIHKLLALAIVIITILLIRTAFIGRSPATLGVVFLVVSLVLLVSLFATGAMLSGERDIPSIVLLLHNIATYAAPVTTGITFFLLF